MTGPKDTTMHQIAVRPARFEDRYALARILIDATLTTFRGRVPDRCLYSLTVEDSATNWGRNFEDGVLSAGEYLYVAEVAGVDVIGLAMAGRPSTVTVLDQQIAQSYPRELVTLQVDPAWQRRGVGRRLVAAVADALLREGESKLLVQVLAENPNAAFYEALGARLAGSQPYDWEGYPAKSLIFVWDDIRALADAVQGLSLGLRWRTNMC